MTAQAKATLACVVLSVMIVISAIAVVYARHESRTQFTQLQSLIVQRDALEVDWGRLQIEQSTWSTYARVERLARKRMAMRMPAPDEIQVVKE
ncbi:MAG: cell division protein FtsL [Gammaproteobacteria bacterium]